MRVLILGPSGDGNLAWYLARALRALGHEAILHDLVHSDSQDPWWSRIQWKITGLDRWAIAQMNRRAERLWRTVRPDLVIVCKGRFLLPETVRGMRQAGLPVVNWYPDGIGEMEREFLIECLPHYTVFFTKDTYLLDRLRGISPNVRYLPLACDPEVHRTVTLSDEERRQYGSDVALVGSGYPFRLIYLPALEPYRLKLWGSAWTARPTRRPPPAWQGRSAMGFDQAKVFNATTINVNTVHFFEVHGTNRRTFDIAGCGGFQVCTAAPEDLPRLFDVGREVLVAKDARELRRVIDYYLAHEEERRAIGRQAQARAHRDHTFRQRLEELLQVVREVSPA